MPDVVVVVMVVVVVVVGDPLPLTCWKMQRWGKVLEMSSLISSRLDSRSDEPASGAQEPVGEGVRVRVEGWEREILMDAKLIKCISNIHNCTRIKIKIDTSDNILTFGQVTSSVSRYFVCVF